MGIHICYFNRHSILQLAGWLESKNYFQGSAFWRRGVRAPCIARSTAAVASPLVLIRDGKERQTSKNEPNQKNPGYAKNWTEPNPESKKCARTRNEPYSNRRQPRKHVFSSIDEPKRTRNLAFTQVEPNMNPVLKSRLLRTRTEQNGYHQRTWIKHEPKIWGSFPSLVLMAI